MAGTDARQVVLQPRDLRVLRLLGDLPYLTSEQLGAAAGFGSKTRVNERLRRLTLAGYLDRKLIGTISGGRQAHYWRTRSGAAVVGLVEQRVRKLGNTATAHLFLEHQMAINEVALALRCAPLPRGVSLLRFARFSTPLSAAAPLIPDAYFEIQTSAETLACFLEVDRGTETLRRWLDKVERYLQLAVSGKVERLFQLPRFRVLVLAHTKTRCETLRRTTARRTLKLFWFASQQQLRMQSLWAPIWSRPASPEQRSLL
jgi:hypothetical protein